MGKILPEPRLLEKRTVSVALYHIACQGFAERFCSQFRNFPRTPWLFETDPGWRNADLDKISNKF